MNEFIITFRESLEAALIVGIIYVFISKNGSQAHKNMVWLSVALSLLASAILGITIYKSLESVGDSAIKELLEGIFMYITAGLLFYVIFWMSKNLASKNALEKETTSVLSEGKKWGIFFLVFFAILREGFETALFLVASTGIDNDFSYIGFFAGIILAVLIGYLIVVRGKKLQLRLFFKYTSLLLVFFAAGMIAYGTHELHEFMEKREHAANHSNASAAEEEDDCAELREHIEHDGGEGAALQEEEEEEEYVFNLFPMKDGNTNPGKMYVLDKECNVYVHILNSKGAVGSFFKGLFGYNSSPIMIELILWIISLIFGCMLWRKAYK